MKIDIVPVHYKMPNTPFNYFTGLKIIEIKENSMSNKEYKTLYEKLQLKKQILETELEEVNAALNNPDTVKALEAIHKVNLGGY